MAIKAVLSLTEYPNAIAVQERAHLKTQQELRTAQAALAEVENAIEKAIAFNESFRNDAQRKAARAEMHSKADYKKALSKAQTLEDKLVEIEIEIRLLKNQFTVAKLLTEQQIAA